MDFFEELPEWLAKRIRSWLPKGRLFRAAALLSGSVFLTQVVSVCLSPINSRLYTPADYGVFGQFYSIVSALMTIGSLCYELAIPNAPDEEEALVLVCVSALVVGIIALGSLGWAVFYLWGAGRNRAYFLLLPLGVLLSGLYRISMYWAVRVQALKAIAAASVKQMIYGQAVILGLGLLCPSPLGLVIGLIISSSAGIRSLTLSTSLLPRLRAHRTSVLRFGHFWSVAKRRSEYALVQGPSTLLNSIGFYLPGMLMLPYFSAEFAGQYNLAQRIGRIPINLVSTSANQVFFSEAAAIGRTDPGKLLPLFNRVSRKLALASLLVLVPCLLSPLAVPFVFGHQWHEAGVLALLLGFGLSFQLGVSPLSNIPNVVRRLRGQFILNALRALLMFAALYVPYKLGYGGVVAVASCSAVMVVNYVACYCLYRHQVTIQATQAGRDVNPAVEILAEG